jgi:aminoglycoside N3'-acetyltransferase
MVQTSGVAPVALTVDRLVSDLHRMGVVAGDVLMVHASMRAVGPVQGGADALIDALDAAVGPDGTLLMTLGAKDGAEPFDALRTPADPDVGVLAEVFRQHRGTIVSDHPEGRFAARGHLAGAFLADVPWDDYYGPGSPLERLVLAGGKVLRLGADPDTVTLLHYAEYLAPVADKRRVVRHRLVHHGDTVEVRSVECLDDSNGIVEYPGDDYFAVILRAYLADGRATTGSVGSARSELLDAADITAFAVTWMAEHLRGPQP